MEEWFLEEFGPYGFKVTHTVYNPDTFIPCKQVIHPDGFKTRVNLTPELANDLRGWGVTYESQVEDYRELIRQELYRQYPEIFKPKDFKPKQNLNQFKF